VGEHPAAVQLCNVLDNRQSQAGAAVFRGKERLERAAANFLAETVSAIGYL
jgi:hypothetical protein